DNAAKVVDDLARRVRAVLTPEQRDEVLLGRPGPSADPFKAPREEDEPSDWNPPGIHANK
ncbi:MAG TPA: hypothetical protein VHC70_08155, partial [Phycisphaerales bacterium]|nr:hypothetical protein [Phycisphaerales bacterium]